jgi:23S rRNA (adenine2030-N6)-methyltransferase
MLSYRHAFHAGNHADVLKHIVLVEVLHYLAARGKRLWYIDTHAGAGHYRLDSSGESAAGIARLWDVLDLPEAAQRYVDAVRRCNPDGRLENYPGSPRIACDAVNAGDRLWLSELHPADHATLAASFKNDTRVRVQKTDGFDSLRALLPPEPRRALVMVDPSYEVKKDYARVVAAVDQARQRFATGVYAIWYPQLKRREAEKLPKQLRDAAGSRWLHATLTVSKAGGERAGLFGSGMFVVNPPHTLPATLAVVLPRLVSLLGQDDGAGFTLDAELP